MQETEGHTPLEEAVIKLEELRTSGSSRLISNQIYLIAQFKTNESAEAIQEIMPSLKGTLYLIAIDALGLNGSKGAIEILEDLSKNRKDLRRQRRAILALSNMGEQGLTFLRDKRLKYESDLNTKAYILEKLLEHEAPNLSKHLIVAAKSKNTIYSGIGLKGIGQLKLKNGLKYLLEATKEADVQLRKTAFQSLAQYGSKRAFNTILEGLEAPINIVIQPELSAALQHAKETKEIEALIEYCYRGDNPEIIVMCVKALSVSSQYQPDFCADSLGNLLKSKDEKVRSLAIEGLVAIKPDWLKGRLIELLSYPNMQTQIDAAWGLSQIGGLPEEVENKLAKMASSSHPNARVQAIQALKWFSESEFAFSVILDGFEDELWSVQSSAIQAVVNFRRTESLPKLILMAKEERGRLRNDAIKSLINLTGEDFGPSAETWQAWFDDRGDSYSLPDADIVESMIEARAKNRHQGHTVAQGTYHGLPVPAGAVIFILDTSGSMSSSYSSSETYFQHFSSGLIDTVNALNNHNFNIILFSTGIKVWRDKLVEATEKNRDDATKWLGKQTVSGATNLYGALKAALSFEDVQTIFVMTDGNPSYGEYQLEDSILAEVARINRDRMIQIHTIVAGNAKAEFMLDLASANGGESIDLTKAKEKNIK